MSTLAGMPRTKVSSQAGPRAETFQEAACIVLASVRTSVGRLIEALPGPIKGAADIQRALDLDWSLSWQLHRVGSVAEPVEAGPDVPRPLSMAKALRAAADKGVPPDTIERVQEAYRDFERLVETHAGDRGSFDAMVRALSPGVAHISMKDRRGAYRSLSSIWGVQADVRYHCGIAHHGNQPDNQTSVVISGYVGLRKLRPGRPIAIGMRALIQPAVETAALESIRFEVLGEFCTQPPAPIQVKSAEPGVIETLLEIGDVGKSGATNHFMRRYIRNAPRDPGPAWGSSVVSRLPTEHAVLDLLVPAGWTDPAAAQVRTYGNLHQRDRGWVRDEADLLPVTESIVHIGQDLERLQTSLVPRCPNMVRAVLVEAGWEKTTFDIFRCLVQYPILNACVATNVPAPRANPA